MRVADIVSEMNAFPADITFSHDETSLNRGILSDVLWHCKYFFHKLDTDRGSSVIVSSVNDTQIKEVLYERSFGNGFR